MKNNSDAGGNVRLKYWAMILALSAICPWSQAQNTSPTPTPTLVFPPRESLPTMPATTRGQAQEAAKNDSGRQDPLAPIKGFKHFPSSDENYQRADGTKVSGKQMLVPAPGARASFNGDNPYLKIPPPPSSPSYSPNASNQLPVSELPGPPDKPSILNMLKLTGIIGNKAIFAVTDLSERLKNKWPRALCLGVGESFESVSVISVDANTAILEENGERMTKNLERIR